MLGFEVWFQNGCGLNWCFASVFEVATKFPQRKFGSILPYFHGGNPTALHLRCVIACQTLFSPSFRHENMAIGMPLFTAKIWQSFTFSALWCTDRVLHMCIWCILTFSHHDEPKPSKVLEYVDTCRIHRETNVTWWHGARQSHHNGCAHNIAWICTYYNYLKRIPIQEGQELLWLERVAHVATRVHHTKCTTTHTHARRYIYIYTCIMHNAITQSKKIN